MKDVLAEFAWKYPVLISFLVLRETTATSDPRRWVSGMQCKVDRKTCVWRRLHPWPLLQMQMAYFQYPATAFLSLQFNDSNLCCSTFLRFWKHFPSPYLDFPYLKRQHNEDCGLGLGNCLGALHHPAQHAVKDGASFDCWFKCTAERCENLGEGQLRISLTDIINIIKTF